MDEFLNPKPKNRLKSLMEEESKHGKMGANLDAIGDIYDHTGSYFGKQETDKDYQAVGDRKLRASIADEEFYPAKKVSRKEREEAMNAKVDSDDSEDVSSPVSDSDQEEGEHEMEEGELEQDEESSIEDFQMQKNNEILHKLSTQKEK